MSGKAVFRSWVRVAATDLSGAEMRAGRLRTALKLSATISTPAGDLLDPVPEQEVEMDLLGPGDVTGFTPRAILRVSPPPGSRDANSEYCAYVDFAAEDLPWRYSPKAQEVNQGMEPWVAVVAGVVDREVGLAADGTLWMSAAVTEAMPPAHSQCWCHVHYDSTGFVAARVLCPRELPPLSDCLAAVVPLFDTTGGYRWQRGQPARGLPVLHMWRFRTVAEGTFRDIAQRLEGRPAPEKLGEGFVRATPTGGPTVDAVAYGALAPRTAPAVPDWEDATVLTRVESMLGAEVAPDAQPVVAPPRPGRQWLPPNTDAVWADQVDFDPRHRGAAGMGRLTGIDWQERILAAAGKRLGSTHLAASLLRRLTSGVALASSLDARHRPSDTAGLVAHYAPALGQLPSLSAGTALDRIAPADGPLPPALLSAAAARLFRAGGAHARASADPLAVGDPGQVIAAANLCPPPRVPPLAPADGAGGDAVDVVINIYFDAHQRHGEDPPVTREQIPWSDRDTGEPGPGAQEREPCDQDALEESLTAVADDIATAFRPDGAMVRRVVERITPSPGRWDVPYEVEPDLDLPAWTWLRDNAPEWLLPNAGRIEPDSVIAVRSNPGFVDALLLGLSSQAVAELRWRGVPLVAGAMPMRTFWQGIPDHDNPEARVDISRAGTWLVDGGLGAPDHIAPGGFGDGLVVAIRSVLFERYPDTIVYLASRITVAGEVDAELEVPREPVVTGRLGEDLTFFGFDVHPGSLGSWIVVIEEPIPEPRFIAGTPTLSGYSIPTEEITTTGGVTTITDGPNQQVANGAEYAHYGYAPPVRVLIDGNDLL